MTTFANHAFAKRSLNVRDENGNEGCAICGRPRGAHPPDNQEGNTLSWRNTAYVADGNQEGRDV